MTALPLFEFDARKKARRTDPDTSHEAARMAGALIAAHRRKILEYLEGIWPMAATYEDIARATGLDKHAVGRRLPELGPPTDKHPDAEDLLVIAGKTELSTGRPGRLWRAKP